MSDCCIQNTSFDSLSDLFSPSSYKQHYYSISKANGNTNLCANNIVSRGFLHFSSEMSTNCCDYLKGLQKTTVH